ncbi:hypothetical protein FA09DRAFT_340713, partial [Tilletiopsis washingtonensis]
MDSLLHSLRRARAFRTTLHAQPGGAVTLRAELQLAAAAAGAREEEDPDFHVGLFAPREDADFSVGLYAPMEEANGVDQTQDAAAPHAPDVAYALAVDRNNAVGAERSVADVFHPVSTAPDAQRPVLAPLQQQPQQYDPSFSPYGGSHYHHAKQALTWREDEERRHKRERLQLEQQRLQLQMQEQQRERMQLEQQRLQLKMQELQQQQQHAEETFQRERREALQMHAWSSPWQPPPPQQPTGQHHQSPSAGRAFPRQHTQTQAQAQAQPQPPWLRRPYSGPSPSSAGTSSTIHPRFESVAPSPTNDAFGSASPPLFPGVPAPRPVSPSLKRPLLEVLNSAAPAARAAGSSSATAARTRASMPPPGVGTSTSFSSAPASGSLAPAWTAGVSINDERPPKRA